jgi:hypothetical protein
MSEKFILPRSTWCVPGIAGLILALAILTGALVG